MTREAACEGPRARMRRVVAWTVVFTGVLAGAHGVDAARADTSASTAVEQPFIALNDIAMDRMMADMAIAPSGDIDRDFVAMMVPHHQGAIDMAQAELRYGRNQQLLRISQEIVVTQLQEIAAMRAAIGDGLRPGATAPNPTEKLFLNDNDIAMARMMDEMAVKPSGNVDHDFVAMMVPHHQGAIDMARTELRYGHNASLRRICQEIIVDQGQEIVLMRLAAGEALPPPSASPTEFSPAPAPDVPTSMQMAPFQAAMR